MPEEKIEIMPTLEEVNANNAAVAQKLAAQDVMGQNNAPKDDGSASGALDALQKEAEAAAAKAKEAPPEVKPVVDVPPAKTAAQIAEEKAAADKVEAARKRADEFFKDSPTLPAGASPKSSESFAAIKVKAAQEIAKLENELAQLKKDNAAAQEKLKNTAPPEAVKELEEHRAWRARLDVEADPKFKEFDKNIDSTREFIYAQLALSPVVTPEIIAEIKKHGGPDKVKMDQIFTAIADSSLQRTIESKLADIAQRRFEKGKAIEAAKTNIGEYVASREKQATEALTQHNSATAKHLAEITKGIDWYSEKPIDPKAEESARKEAEAHNAFLATTKKQLDSALTDDSPEMRAIMIAGMAQLFHLQNVHEGTKSQLTELKKSLADVTAKYEKLKSGSVTRLRESQANPSAVPPVVKDENLTQDAGTALDNLRKRVTEERERAAAAGA